MIFLIPLFQGGYFPGWAYPRFHLSPHMISFGRTANQISHGLSFDANAHHFSTSRPHVITWARRCGRTDFSHSSKKKNDLKKIPPPWKCFVACLFMTRLFARSSYPKNRKIPSHMELLQRTKYLKLPCYLCWYTKSWMVKLTLSLHQSNIQHLPKWMASKSSTQLMKEIRVASW